MVYACGKGRKGEALKIDQVMGLRYGTESGFPPLPQLCYFCKFFKNLKMRNQCLQS